MAQIVAGIACSHVPLMTSEDNWSRLGEAERNTLRSGFSLARQLLEESRPDVLITFADDHFDRCFYDNLPAFLIGVGEEAVSPATTASRISSAVCTGHAAKATANGTRTMKPLTSQRMQSPQTPGNV